MASKPNIQTIHFPKCKVYSGGKLIGQGQFEMEVVTSKKNKILSRTWKIVMKDKEKNE